MATYTTLNAFKSYLNQKLAYNVPALTLDTFEILFEDGFEIEEIIDIQLNKKGLIHLGGNLYRSIYTLQQVVIENYEVIQTPIIRLPIVKSFDQVAKQVTKTLDGKRISSEIRYESNSDFFQL